MVHQVFNDAFEALLAGWHRHMDLVATTDDILKLAESRRELDALARRAHRAREARNPGHAEFSDGHLTAYCPFLATTVDIPTSEVRQTPHDTLQFECICEREVGHAADGWFAGATVAESGESQPVREPGTLRRLRLVGP